MSRNTVHKIKKQIMSGKKNINTRMKRRLRGISREERTQKYKEE